MKDRGKILLHLLLLAPALTACVEAGLTTPTGSPSPEPSPSPIVDVDITETHTVTIASTSMDLNRTIQLPQYTGAKQLEKALLTVNLVPVGTAGAESTNNTASISATVTLTCSVTGQGDLSPLSNSDQQIEHGSATAGGPGQWATATIPFTAYSFTVELDFPDDAPALAALSGSGQISLVVADVSQWNETAYTGGNGSTSGSSSISGSVSITYTYPQ